MRLCPVGMTRASPAQASWLSLPETYVLPVSLPHSGPLALCMSRSRTSLGQWQVSGLRRTSARQFASDVSRAALQAAESQLGQQRRVTCAVDCPDEQALPEGLRQAKRGGHAGPQEAAGRCDPDAVVALPCARGRGLTCATQRCTPPQHRYPLSCMRRSTPGNADAQLGPSCRVWRPHLPGRPGGSTAPGPARAQR